MYILIYINHRGGADDSKLLGLAPWTLTGYWLNLKTFSTLVSQVYSLTVQTLRPDQRLIGLESLVDAWESALSVFITGDFYA